MKIDNFFETDENFYEPKSLAELPDIPVIQIDFSNDTNAVLYGGIGAQLVAHKLDRLTLKNNPMVSCKVVEVSTGKVVAETTIMAFDFSPKPIKAPYDRTIKKELGPINLAPGQYRLDIYALWLLLPNILGGYGLVGTGYLFTRDGNTFASETFQPKEGSMIGEARRSINF